jgi:uncharacterized protein (TIGR03067 family)
MGATAVLVLGLVLSAERGAADDAKTIQGTWVVTPATLDGAALAEGAREEALKAIKGMRFTFQEGKLTITGQPGPRPSQKGVEDSSDYRLDPTKKPKQIDLSGSMRGIYDLDGDTLKLCLDIRGKENGRPDKFGFDKDKPTVVYYVLKREKP